MAHPVAVLNVVGLSESLLSDRAPNLRRLIDRGRQVRLRPVLPAVTTAVQSSMLTGLRPSGHGIVGNGWYHRDLAEVRFWHRSNHLVQGEKVWETARRRDPSVTCANLFWWYNTYSTSDVILQVRPVYKADGRKLPDCWSEPAELRQILQRELGQFPLFKFWGPAADISSTRWITEAALRIHRAYHPTLLLVYLPHLDYPLQKFGPGTPEVEQAVAEVDREVGRLIDYFDDSKVRALVVSEYGIGPVDSAVAINKSLREAGWLSIRIEDGLELMDYGSCEAFAVADHQIAHVYVRKPADVAKVKGLCSGVHGVESVLDRREQAAVGLDHERAGDLVLVAEPGRWFTYDWWLDDAKAPDFARTVDIHRKPGYDPRELFIDPAIRRPKAAIGKRLLKKKLGFRTLMDVITLDSSLVKGSHGRVDVPPELAPVLIAPGTGAAPAQLPCEAVRDVILSALFDEQIELRGGE